MIKTLYETFQHWSNKGSVWLYSDPHFDDNESEDYGWIPTEERIKRINVKVHKNDTLICLGDCGNIERFKELKCKNKVLIMGNHDDHGIGYYKGQFNEVYDGPLFISDKILLSHEPVIGLYYCLNIHGHSHQGQYEWTDMFDGKHLNIASDVVNWEPINLGELIKKGVLADIQNIHRVTIDSAVERKNEGISD